MIEETGRVVAVEAGAVWVETVRRGTCGTCNARQGCGHRVINRDGAGSRARVRALSGTDLRVDDRVMIGIPESLLMRGALRVYLLPLVLLFLGALLGNRLDAGGDLPGILGLAGLACGFLYNRWYSRRHEWDSDHHPRVLRVLPGHEANTISCEQQ